ncbi:MAG: winged helix-turn-helix transcriptional regulator [Oscillospiraceae bacterium]|nr:winged helix-turn-helix transcriptional regulator [Oscillospiraceae bacterium]
MAERDYGTEIDALRNDINEIKELLKGSNDKSRPDSKIFDKMKDMSTDKHLNSLMDRIQNECEADGSIGKVVYLGVFASGGRQSNWISELKADDLLKLIENRTAEKVLACIGSSDKLNILLALLKKTMTVAQLVSECGFNSTGQVYHHLNTLIAADLVQEDLEYCGKGYYIVIPYRVQGIVMLLSGINDMLDTRYSSGSWNESK